MKHDEQLLIDHMRQLGYGRYEGVPVRNGVARINRDTKVLRPVQYGHEILAHPPKSIWIHRPPHRLHRQLIIACREAVHGLLQRIDVADGLPVHWEWLPKQA